MSKWEEKKLGELCQNIFSGGTPSTSNSDYWNGEFFWLSSGETSNKYIVTTSKTITKIGVDNSSTRLAKENDVVMACAGQGKTRGQTSYLKNDMYINQSVIALRVFEDKLNSKYLLHYLSLKYDELRYLSDASSTRGSITTDMLRKMKITIPDLPTQKRIADILSSYDDLIENNNRRIELLEKSAQDLYKEWFVRFRFPNHENTKFVNGLPEGWKVEKLGKLCEITSSKRVYLSDYVEKGIPFYRSKEIIQLSNGQSVSNELFISNNDYQNFKNKFGAPCKNDILITSVGTIGSSYISDGHEFYFKDGNLTWLKTSPNKFLSIFIYSWLNSLQGKQSLNLYTIGTSQSALTIENLRKIKIIVPSNSILESYSDKVGYINNFKCNLFKQNQNLKKQRDLLLPRLMSGKLEV